MSHALALTGIVLVSMVFTACVIGPVCCSVYREYCSESTRHDPDDLLPQYRIFTGAYAELEEEDKYRQTSTQPAGLKV